MEQLYTNVVDAQLTNIVIVGKQGTGKTALLNKLGKTSVSDYPDGINFNNHGLELNKGENRIMISELSLSSPLNSACLLNIIKADAYILVYGIDDYESFDYIEHVKDFLRAHKGDCASMLVLGNKADIATREVLFEIADCTVTIEWELDYLETSAATGANISKILPTLLKNMKFSSDDIETYEFKGVTFQRNTSKSMRNPRSSLLVNIFSRNKSRSMKDTSDKDENEPPRKLGFSFWTNRSRKSSSRRKDCRPNAASPTSLVQLLTCLDNNDK